MGLNISKRIEKTLSASDEFTASCGKIYTQTLTLAQHAFPGVRRYQLLDASTRLHTDLQPARIPILTRWAPPPPTQSHVDSALSRIGFEGETLDEEEFRRFEVELFRDLITGEIVGAVVLKGVPVGAAGIAGVGMSMGSGPLLVGRLVGVYAAGVAAAVYLSLS